MTELSKKPCLPCEKKTKPLEAAEVKKLLSKIKGWKVLGNKKIEREFQFGNFREALVFVNEVGDLAEFEGHHPDIFLHDWNKVLISLWTHAIEGLSENDFILAAKIEEIQFLSRSEKPLGEYIKIKNS